MPNYRVVVTCKEVKGHCGVGMTPGDTVTFEGVNVKGRICIGALASMMATVFAMRHGVNFPWLKDPNVARHVCPDAANPVLYEIRREPLP